MIVFEIRECSLTSNIRHLFIHTSIVGVTENAYRCSSALVKRPISQWTTSRIGTTNIHSARMLNNEKSCQVLWGCVLWSVSRELDICSLCESLDSKKY
jgi:hypothetical protein